MFRKSKSFPTMRLEGAGMSNSHQTWVGDWRERIRERVQSLGSESVRDFLEHHPAEPYFKVARRLGNDVAAVQLARMQFEEAADQDEVRQAAMDGFSREILENLKRGWGVGKHADFRTASVYAGWMALLEFRADAPDLRPKGDAVWISLTAIQPPHGWLPSGPNDPIIQAAFAQGWPPHEVRQVQMASFRS
jgi:hypothetical protein